jgi:NitT/TauT family transport system substrate-binding protein
MIVRANGLTVRGVALLGGQPMFQIAVRTATGIRSIAELRGKKVGVIGYQDTGYYALLGALAASGLRRADLQIQAVGPAAITQLMIAGNLDAIMATPDWADNIEVAGIPLTYFPIDALFPAMAQAVLASDKVVAEKPAVVRGFVRAMLKALRETMADPAAAARDFIAAVPQHAGKETEIERITRAYGAKVYRTDNLAELGRFDPARLERVQRFYIENQIIQAAAPIADLYTNDFVGN